jgi:mono/diheme cytochrome c family protein
MKRWIICGLTMLLVISIVMVFAGCSSPVTPGGQVPGTSFESNGQRIYFTASSSSGEPISYTGSIRMMHTITCVNCHGPTGEGGTVYMMMQSFDVPNITWSHLTEEEHEEEGHEEHPPYTEETVKQAITQGLDPAGEPLDEFMPKWRMSSQDLDDLVAFVKTLQ